MLASEFQPPRRTLFSELLDIRDGLLPVASKANRPVIHLSLVCVRLPYAFCKATLTAMLGTNGHHPRPLHRSLSLPAVYVAIAVFTLLMLAAVRVKEDVASRWRGRRPTLVSPLAKH